MVKNLKLLRTKKGLSQKQLADIIGTSQQSINKYENHNVEPDIDTLIAFADFFNTSVDYLIGNTDFSCAIASEDEQDIILKFRCMSKRGKRLFLAMMEELEEK